MQAIITPSTLSGTVTAPASKSAMQRACAAALIKGGETVLQNPGNSDDDLSALRIIGQLGALSEKKDGEVLINSRGVQAIGGVIDCGESGLSARMFTSVAALHSAPLTITGKGSLLQRPFHFFEQVFPQLSVHCTSNQGLLPLQIRGPLQPHDITIDGSLSSQFLTGLLFAFSAAGARNKTIHVQGLNSRPYIDLSLQVLADFGLKTPENRNYQEFYFDDRLAEAAPKDRMRYAVEGDWSGAAFLLVAGAIASQNGITVRGLDLFSAQADMAVLRALNEAGAQMDVQEGGIFIRQSALEAFHFNATDCPDLFPPLVALAVFCKGSSVIKGVHRLTHKESNRAQTLQEEFKKMGVAIELEDDLMIIDGKERAGGAHTNSHHDHRIAMACAITALRAEGRSRIDGAEAVNKSYPDFWRHLQQLQAGLSLINT